MKDATIKILIFSFFFLVFFSTAAGRMNSLDAPNYELTTAIVKYKTLEISKSIQFSYPDFATYEGKMFIDREPIHSILNIPNYYLAQRLQDIAFEPKYTYQHTSNPISVEVLTYGFSGVFAALALVIAYSVLREMKFPQWVSVLTVFLMGAATNLLLYASGFVRQPYSFLWIMVLLYLEQKNKSKAVNLSKLYYHCAVLFILLLLVLTDSFSILFVSIYALYYISTNVKVSNSKKILQVLQKNKIKSAIAIIIAISPIIFQLLYNYALFGNSFKFSKNYHQEKAPSIVSNMFSMPLSSSIPDILISDGSISEEDLAYLDEPKYEGLTPHKKYIIQSDFEGIFVETPLLIIAVISLFLFTKDKRKHFYILLIIGYLLTIGKFYHYMNPTVYDLRYFMPLIVILMMGMAPFFKHLSTKKKNAYFYFLVLITTLFAYISIRKQVINLATHFAPHVNYFKLTITPNTKSSDIIANAFPNVINIHIGIIYLVLVFLLVLIVKKVHSLYKQKSKKTL